MGNTLIILVDLGPGLLEVKQVTGLQTHLLLVQFTL